MSENVTISREELKTLAREAGREGAREMFVTIGLDVSTPSGIIQAQRDWDHLRGWRKASDTVKRQGIITATAIIITGALGALWLAIKGPPI